MFAISGAQAQTPPAPTQQADVARQQSLHSSAWNGSVTGEGENAEGGPLAAPKMAGDDEYGEQRILLRRASWAPWSVEVDAQVLWTDNVALANRNEQSDTYLRTGLRVGYANRVVGNLFVNASWDYHTVRHSEAIGLDFDLGRGDLGFMYMLPQLRDAFLVARYSYFRLTEVGGGSVLFEDHVLSLGLQKLWKISRGQQIFAGGLWRPEHRPAALGGRAA
ncbi:MAG: hypothetical protein U0984_12460 [Prosthecobacter sp.]|nr:hypothetical protein [Prosthecobacter sp.]